MFSTWRIGSIAGIGVFVHWTFLLLLVVFAGMDVVKQGPRAGLEQLASILLLFAIVVLHEAGHALAARRFGIGTRDITLYPIGGVARLERMPRKPVEEIVVSLAGPAVNLVLAAGAYAVLPLLNGTVDIWLARHLLVINLALALFNLLPAFPMDGGRVLRALLALKHDFLKATAIAARIGRLMAFVFAIIGIFGVKGVFPPSFMLVLIAVFVWIAAGAEHRAVALEYAARGTQGPLHWFVNIPRDQRWSMKEPGVREADFEIVDNKRE